VVPPRPNHQRAFTVPYFNIFIKNSKHPKVVFSYQKWLEKTSPIVLWHIECSATWLSLPEMGLRPVTELVKPVTLGFKKLLLLYNVLNGDKSRIIFLSTSPPRSPSPSKEGGEKERGALKLLLTSFIC
jgi:hypothetical protein